ncbi:hypothetical protein [Actinoplanes sp. NPDC051411]|uniref:hypothetical protein n=1 Tax=Actinoplanes sp. NPDC051411 TaxID=3155522 RepID=UPI00342D36D3
MIDYDRRNHPAAWWAQFDESSNRLDAGTLTDALSDVITPTIPSALLRREAEIATETVLRHLNRPGSEEAAEAASRATARLVATVERINERSTGDDAGTAEAYAQCLLLQGMWAEAAAEIEPLTGTVPLIRAFVSALRLDGFGIELTLRLLKAGQDPAVAVRSSLAVGRYSWWPEWLLTIVTERVIAGTVDAETINALQRCAFAELSPSQARMAKRLFNAEPQLVEAAAARLENLGEHPAARLLRDGDLGTVAFAARLIPV